MITIIANACQGRGSQGSVRFYSPPRCMIRLISLPRKLPNLLSSEGRVVAVELACECMYSSTVRFVRFQPVWPGPTWVGLATFRTGTAEECFPELLAGVWGVATFLAGG
jgi:hypothetical protein